MTGFKTTVEHESSKVEKLDPYEFLDDSDGADSATEKLSASDLMLEPGTLSKRKLDTADLKLLNSEESEKHHEDFRTDASTVPMTFPPSG